MKKIVIKSDLDSIDEVISTIITEIENYTDEQTMYSIRLMVSEIIINAHCHGNCGDSSKNIEISFKATKEKFRIRIKDEGEGFDPNNVPNPLLSENLDKPSGRGIYLVREISDELIFHGKGNDIEIIKNWSKK